MRSILGVLDANPTLTQLPDPATAATIIGMSSGRTFGTRAAG
jgi:hypothetical protein